MDKYDSTSERVDNSTFEERFFKFAKIFKYLKKENITVVDFYGAAIELEDKTCGFNLKHAMSTWEVFRAVDVADMIICARNEYLSKQ